MEELQEDDGSRGAQLAKAFRVFVSAVQSMLTQCSAKLRRDGERIGLYAAVRQPVLISSSDLALHKRPDLCNSPVHGRGALDGKSC